MYSSGRTRYFLEGSLELGDAAAAAVLAEDVWNVLEGGGRSGGPSREWTGHGGRSRCRVDVAWVVVAVVAVVDVVVVVVGVVVARQTRPACRSMAAERGRPESG